jgi:nucleotide-binding universal stress UspA family protein
VAGLIVGKRFMYSHILVPLENSPADETVLEHVVKLAKTSSAHVSLIHVADGYVARNYDQLELAPSQEMREDVEYLNRREAELKNLDIPASAHLAWGEPADEIIKFAEEIGCDLIAMATHGHGLVADFVLGSVTRSVRHRTNIPVLLIRACHKS